MNKKQRLQRILEQIHPTLEIAVWEQRPDGLLKLRKSALNVPSLVSHEELKEIEALNIILVYEAVNNGK